MQSCRFASTNLFFVAVLVAVAVVVAKAPYCCDPKILLRGNIMSHFSSLLAASSYKETAPMAGKSW